MKTWRDRRRYTKLHGRLMEQCTRDEYASTSKEERQFVFSMKNTKPIFLREYKDADGKFNYLKDSTSRPMNQQERSLIRKEAQYV